MWTMKEGVGGSERLYTKAQVFVSTDDEVELRSRAMCSDVNTKGASPASFFTTRNHHLLVVNELLPKHSVSSCLHGCNMAAFSKDQYWKPFSGALFAFFC